MSLTSYRAAPPRVMTCARCRGLSEALALGRPGSDLLSRILRYSTIGAEGFHGRVRNGIGCTPFATTTGSSKHTGTRGLKARTDYSGKSRQRTSTAARNEGDQADRVISTAKLNASLHLHMRPINVVVYHDSQRDLVLRRVSRLDAFSVYPFTT